MKKIIFILWALILPMLAIADAVEIDGVYYNLVSKINSAEVTSNPNKYTGVVRIPNSVIYEGKKYNVNSIGEKAFLGCSSLSSITIPNSINTIGQDAFKGCYGLKKTIVSDIAAWCNINFGAGYSRPLYFSKRLYYDESTEIKNLVIPDGVTSIGEGLFLGCAGLVSVTFPNSVITIGNSSFSDCTGLTTVTIPNSVTTIEGGAFTRCSSLTSITIPNSVTTIEGYVFHECTGLSSVTIPNSVTYIGMDSFSGCTSLSSITIPNSVTTIEERAFSNCSSLTSITIPNSVTTIGGHAFLSCSSLTSITIPNSVTTIEAGAFSWCTNLSSVTIPYGVTSIGQYALGRCTSLSSIIIPSSVTTIGEHAFEGCTSLSSITIPNSVTTIGEHAFEGCDKLTTMTIGIMTEYIGSQAFANCKELLEITCYAEKVPYTFSDAFQNSYIEYATLHVPALSLEQYSVTAPWNGFGKILSTNGDLPDPEVKTCAVPTISYANGLIKFDCQTDGAICHYTLADDDIKTGDGNIVSLTATYNISVYATKEGYEKSEVATATLCWIDAEPMQEGTKEAEDGVTEVKAIPVLIQAEGNTISVQGATEGTDISVFNTAGIKQSSTIANKGITTLNTSLSAGSTAIVKIGEKAVKVLVK